MRTIAFLSSKGGAGKTTLAVHIVVAAEQASQRSVVLDLDPQGSATVWGDVRVGRTPAVVPTQVRHLERVLAAARATDLVLVPCRPTLFDLHAVRETLAIARLAETPAKVIVNAVPPRGTFSDQAREAIATYAMETAPYEVGHRVAYMHALVRGITAQEYQPKSKAADEIERLYQWIMTEVLG